VNNIALVVTMRTGSSRLPGKMTKQIADGKCSIDFFKTLFDRLEKQYSNIKTVIAIPEDEGDAFVNEFKRRGMRVFKGSEENVLMRVVGAAKSLRCQYIMDITGDCPFVSKALVDSMLTTIMPDIVAGRKIYCSNVFPKRTSPDGQDIQVYNTEYADFVLNKCEYLPEHSGWNVFGYALTDETVKLDPRSPKLVKLFNEEEKFLTAHGIRPDDIESVTKLTKVEVSEIAAVRAQLAISKIPAALELMETIREEQETPAPVTLYCYHRAVLAALKNAIETKYPKMTAAYIDGGVDAKKRHEIIKEKFQTGKLDILCATIGALREGLNLTNGQDVLFLELDYVPANMSQAIGRFWRRGQKNEVHVRRLVYDAGIEKRILKIIKEKTTTIDKIMGA